MLGGGVDATTLVAALGAVHKSVELNKYLVKAKLHAAGVHMNKDTTPYNWCTRKQYSTQATRLPIGEPARQSACKSAHRHATHR